jgi:drug/metabolite transporter (DMT)-like permease
VTDLPRGNTESPPTIAHSEASHKGSPFAFIFLSACLFGLSVPFSKILLDDVPAIPLAGLLYLGAFGGLSLYSVARRSIGSPSGSKPPRLARNDVPWLAGATISGGIVAPVSLMLGLSLMSGFSTSLLLNIEGVATAVIAVIVFKENAGKNLWIALLFMTAAGVLLGWNPGKGEFDIVGIGLIVLAMVCWGIDNNLTRMICTKDAVQITQVKGLAAGVAILAAATAIGEDITLGFSLALALIVGALTYGASLVLFIRSLERLGSLRTGAFFSLGPFVGAAVSVIVLGEWLGWLMLPAAALMALGAWLIVAERHDHRHTHEANTHDHLHDHCDDHHMHGHFGTFHEPHSHEHVHLSTTHDHIHRPDSHHRHEH